MVEIAMLYNNVCTKDSINIGEYGAVSYHILIMRTSNYKILLYVLLIIIASIW